MTGAAEAADLRRRDAAARATAQGEFGRPVVIEAGAGSGKTTLLVARVVVWSLGPGWSAAVERLAASPRADRVDADRIAAEVLGRIAAITFTDAAAAELARRTGEALVDVASGRTPTGVLPDALPAAADRAERARALVGALDHLVVRTIHAFCRRLLAQFALEAGIHPSFEVDADGLAQEEVVREVVEAAVEEGYGEPGDPDLVELGIAGIGPARIERALADLVAAGAIAADLAVSPFDPARVRGLVAELAAALADFLAVESGCLAAASRSPVAIEVCEALAATGPALAAFAGDDGAALDGLAAELRDAWPDKRLDRLGAWADAVFNQSEGSALGDRAAALAERAGPLHEALAGLLALRPLTLERARRALGPLLERAREMLRIRGAVPYEQLLRGARDLLRDHPAVRRRVRADLDQLLVDEFQDTDPVQCEIIQWIALEGSEDASPGLFLVGDPKQSIYGWRNADLAAYDAFLERVLGADGEPERLSVNYRSFPDILDEVERVVAPVMRAEAGLQPAFQKLVASDERAAGAPEGPRVEHWISWGWNGENGEPELRNAAATARLEARALAADLRARHGEGSLQYRDVGVLFRGGGDLDLYLQELRSAGVPYAVERDRSYYRRREIIEAAALVRCVLDPDDHVALLAWLRSASVGVPDAALLPLWSRDFPPLVTGLAGPDPEGLARIDAVIEAAAAALPAGVPGLERVAGWDDCLREAIAVIGELRASFEADAADVFVEKLRSLTLIEATEAARFLGAFRVANLARFFRELRDQLEAGGDSSTLLRRLRSAVDSERDEAEARPASALDDAVRVMTIHKAKGLGFGHTYVVQLHKESGRGASESEAVFQLRSDGCDYRLFDAPTPGFRAVQRQAVRVAAAEQVRSLYVAMTRAEDRLVLLGRWPESPQAVEPERAKSHVALLAARSPAAPDLLASMAALAAAGGANHLDAAATRWSFPALVPPAPASLPEQPGATLPAADALRAAARALRSWRSEAAQREGLAWNRAPSADAHAERREARVEQGGAEADGAAVGAAGAAERGAAMAAGVALHRILEEFDLAADVGEELARQRRRLPELLAATGATRDLAAAQRRAEAVIESLAGGSLLRRLGELADHVVARELAVLLPAGEDAVGFIAGSIDLCHRDPDTDEWVVVDYKTDPAADARARAALVERYAEQGRHYQRAVREALQLEADPRFELWFLDADCIERVA